MDCTTLEAKARHRLERQLRRLARRDSPLEASPRLVDAQQPCGRLDWLMHDLVRLVSDSAGVPVAELRPTIRRILTERLFVDCNGDTALSAVEQVDLDLFVRAVVDVLESVRSESIEAGQWSSTPMAPQMFG